MNTKSLVAFLSLALCCAAPARAQTLEWIQQLGTSERDESHGASADGLGNVYITGETIGSSWHQEVLISKYDASGTLQWIQQFGTDGKNVYGRDVSADGLGNVYITGETRGGSLGGAFAGGFSDAFVAKYVDLAVQADFDGDGDVDGDDFLAWQVGFGAQAGAQKSDGDYDNDGDVDGDDFIGWQTQFDNGGNAAGAAVPEPSSVLLLLAALSLSLTGPILRNVTRAA